MIDVKELNILNRTDCQCGTHNFTLKDVKSVEQLQDAHGFYGNLVKHYAPVQCPECHNITVLLLKQVGQTWEIMNTAVTKSYLEECENITENETENVENSQNTNLNEEFICPECKKVCKSKIGLLAHIKIHQN